jgi:hypothetical protein
MCNFNDEVLMQEYIAGDEYMVNAVTFEGKHVITDIWHSGKIIQNGHIIYDIGTLLPFEGKIQSALVEYTKNVLDALDLKFGCSHNEVFMTAEGPVLVELNPRITGGQMSKIAYSCIGECQISYLEKIVSSIIAQDNYFCTNETGYSLKKHACTVDFISNKQGLVKALKNLEKIKALESFLDLQLRVGIGDEIKMTHDLATSPGIVFLAHADESIVMKNCADIRRLEDSLFVA